MATPAFVHAKFTIVQISSTNFNMLTADYDETLSDLSDITYSQAGGATFQILLPGYNGAKGSVAFVYDTANQPVLGNQNMIPGTLMTFIISPDGSKLFTFSAYSSEFKFSGGPQTKGPVACTTNWSSTGTITRPSS